MGLCFAKEDAKSNKPQEIALASLSTPPTPAPTPAAVPAPTPAPAPVPAAEPKPVEPAPAVVVEPVHKTSPSAKDLESVWTNRDEGLAMEMLQNKKRVSLFGIPLTELLTLEADEVDILLSEERTPQDIADGMAFLSDEEYERVLQAATPDLANAIRAVNKENRLPEKTTAAKPTATSSISSRTTTPATPANTTPATTTRPVSSSSSSPSASLIPSPTLATRSLASPQRSSNATPTTTTTTAQAAAAPNNLPPATATTAAPPATVTVAVSALPAPTRRETLTSAPASGIPAPRTSSAASPSTSSIPSPRKDTLPAKSSDSLPAPLTSVATAPPPPPAAAAATTDNTAPSGIPKSASGIPKPNKSASTSMLRQPKATR